MKINGLNGLQKKLKEIEKKANEASGSIPFSDIFTSSFMQRNTNFQSIEEFFDKSPFKGQKLEDIDQKELDQYIAKETKFNNWEDMKGAGGKEYMARKLGFK